MQSVSGRHDGRRILLQVAVLGSDNPADLTFVRATALLDTGATSSALSPRIVKQLALQPFAKRPLLVATEERLVDYYLFRIGLFETQYVSQPYDTTLPYVFTETEGFRLRDSQTFEVILGMDVIGQCDLTIGRNGAWALRYG